MTDFVILHLGPDGPVATFPAPGFDPRFVATKDIPPDAPYVFSRVADLPDLDFIDAWHVDLSDPHGTATDLDSLPKPGIVIDMPKARDIWRSILRAARAPLFQQIDIEFQRAMETGADTTDIVARKNALRDVTEDPRIEAARSIEDLKAVWPDALVM